MTRHRLQRSFFALVVLLACVCAGCGAQDSHRTSGSPPDTLDPAVGNGNRVVLLVIDGLRYTESFGDPTAAHIPRMAGQLRTEGALFTDFRNEGQTKTNPGHASIVTGTWQDIANDGSERPDKPTIFEYFRSHYAAPASAAWMIAGKPKLAMCSYSTDPDYGAAFGATENAGDWSDAVVVDSVFAVLRRVHPVLVVANLPDVDDVGHEDDREGYLEAIETADSLALEVWRALQADTFYAGRTYLFITSDHGRHDDAHGGFENHGCSCEGCEHVVLLLLGPDVAPGQTVSETYTLRDLCSTVGEVLGCPVPESEGTAIEEAFARGSNEVPVEAR
jgi:hypothetical protein